MGSTFESALSFQLDSSAVTVGSCPESVTAEAVTERYTLGSSSKRISLSSGGVTSVTSELPECPRGDLRLCSCSPRPQVTLGCPPGRLPRG